MTIDIQSNFMYFFAVYADSIRKHHSMTNDKKVAPKANKLPDSRVYASSKDRALVRANAFRTHIVNMNYCETGPWWGEDSIRETDSLHHIEVPLSGHRQVLHEQSLLDLTAGNVYFLPGNTPVKSRHITSGKTMWIRFWCEWLPGVDPLVGWPERAPRVLGSADMSYWKKWLDPDSISDTKHLLELRSRLEHWLVEALPSLDAIIDQHLQTHAQFEAIFHLIESKLGADLRIAELAKAHGSTPHAFTRAFLTATKSTPKAYVNRRLNVAASQLVLGSNLTIKEIAEQLRFTDEFYFSRFFKKLNGCSPNIYRKRFRGR